MPHGATETLETNPPAPAKSHAIPRVGMVIGVFLAWDAVMWAVIAPLAAPSVPGGWPALLGLAVLAFSPLFVFLRGFRGKGAPSAFTRLFILRPFWYAQFSLPLLAITGLAGVLVGIPFGAFATFGRWALAGSATVIVIGILVGYFGSRRLIVRELEVAFNDLPAELAGMRIAQLSDLHVGPHTPRGHIARILRAVEAARPDIIAHTGDQVDDHIPDVAYFVAAVGALEAPLGVYAIPGNHDVYAGWQEVHAGLEAARIRVLVNDAVAIKHAGAEFWIAGTGDPAGKGTPAGPDIDKTVARLPGGAFTIALAHNPALWPGLAERGIQLTLSGHTHHGQISIPSLKWSLASPFLDLAMGAYAKGRSLLYINPGTNYWGLPLRIGAWPEVTILTLARHDEIDARVTKDVVRRAR